MKCCDWNTFKDGFLAAWERKSAGPILIDWDRAKTDWKQYGCTGAEAASMQLHDLATESEYVWLGKTNRPKDGDGGICKEPVSV